MATLPARMNALAFAAVTTTALFGTALAPAPASAASGPYYVAELAAPTDKTKLIAKGTMWVCAETKCIAAKARSRPLRICRGLQREVGTISAFKFDGEALAADRLEQCNG